ncbi:hypothetical protein EON64_03800 [archaeon]|nr:MAG: hypothetical protein EON64_03800 [archaeon]
MEDFETEDDKSVSSAKSNHHTLEFGGGVASTEIAVVKQQTGLIVATSNNTEPMSYARDISNHVSTTPRVIASPKVVGQEPEERFLLVEQVRILRLPMRIIYSLYFHLHILLVAARAH